MYKPEANLLRNNEADPLLKLICCSLALPPHPYVECFSPRHRGNHLENLKAASHRALTQQKQEDGLEETLKHPKCPSSLNGPG